jgi:hypothetical protein
LDSLAIIYKFFSFIELLQLEMEVTESRGQKRNREFLLCGDDNDRDMRGEYVKQLESQRISSRYVQRVRKRAAPTVALACNGSQLLRNMILVRTLETALVVIVLPDSAL